MGALWQIFERVFELKQKNQVNIGAENMRNTVDNNSMFKTFFDVLLVKWRCTLKIFGNSTKGQAGSHDSFKIEGLLDLFTGSL